MANLVEEAAKPEWIVPGEPGEPAGFDVERFLATNLNFTGRIFDAVILWDTADYLPEVLLPAVLDRIQSVMKEGGLMLAFFHTKAEGPETAFSAIPPHRHPSQSRCSVPETIPCFALTKIDR